MTRKTKFGTWQPNFPDILIMASAVVNAPKLRKQTLHTFPRVFASSDEMADYIETVLENYHNDPEAVKIKFGPLYVSMLKYSRGIELKKEYWTGGQFTEFSSIRQTLFARMISEDRTIKDWQIVVTPDGKKGKKQSFSAGLPVKGENATKDIEAFMKYSDWHVDPSATHAAIYTVIEDMVFNWEGKIFRKTKNKRG